MQCKSSYIIIINYFNVNAMFHYRVAGCDNATKPLDKNNIAQCLKNERDAVSLTLAHVGYMQTLFSSKEINMRGVSPCMEERKNKRLIKRVPEYYVAS